MKIHLTADEEKFFPAMDMCILGLTDGPKFISLEVGDKLYEYELVDLPKLGVKAYKTI